MPYYRLFYHFVWATKNRLPLITPAIGDMLYPAIRAKVTDLGGLTHALNGLDEHVHLLATVPPKLALADFIGQIKGNSSHLISHKTTEPFAWQREYGVLSVSESHLPIIANYVVEQQQRHAENKLDARLESIPTEIDN